MDSTDCPYTQLVVAIVSHWLSLSGSAVPNGQLQFCCSIVNRSCLSPCFYVSMHVGKWSNQAGPRVIVWWLQKTYFLNEGEFMKVSYENDGEKIFAKRQATYLPGWGPPT